MVVFCLMRTGRAIDCNVFRPIGWGQLEEDSTGQSKGQTSSDLLGLSKSKETSHSKLLWRALAERSSPAQASRLAPSFSYCAGRPGRAR